jgi:hypothetical protein
LSGKKQTRPAALAELLNARTARDAALEDMRDAIRILDGLLPAASTALDGRVHSEAEIDRGYNLAIAAKANLVAADRAFNAARETFHRAASDLLEVYHDALIAEARRLSGSSTKDASDA